MVSVKMFAQMVASNSKDKIAHTPDTQCRTTVTLRYFNLCT